jgi:hypothetical protein
MVSRVGQQGAPAGRKPPPSQTQANWDRGRMASAGRAERIALAAVRVAERLEQMGLVALGGDVRRVCRSNRSYRETCRRLYLDNVELRKRAEQLERGKA